MIRIALADDHHIVRKGLQALLSCEPDFQIVAEAANGLGALEIAEGVKPDILILDLMMPEMSGLEVTKQLTQKCPQTAIIILSMHSNEAYIHEALRSGAKGYILKDNSAEELITAIREVSAGRNYLGSSLPEQTVRNLINKTGAIAPASLEKLTPRENEIMQLAVRGWSNNHIANQLGISQRTVETHCTSLMRKLDVSNRNQLVHFAIQHGIVSINEIAPPKSSNR